jgi:hypothetical protein
MREVLADSNLHAEFYSVRCRRRLRHRRRNLSAPPPPPPPPLRNACTAPNLVARGNAACVMYSSTPICMRNFSALRRGASHLLHLFRPGHTKTKRPGLTKFEKD